MCSMKNRMIASVLSLAMMTASTVELPVDAATIPTINTNFEYELKAEIVSQSQIKLTFYTTTNPGVANLGLALLYNPEKFTCVDFDMDNTFSTSTTCGLGNNMKNGVLFIGITTNPNAINNEVEDYKENFFISIYLSAKDGNATDEALYEFSAAVTDYVSLTENITMDSRLTDSVYVPENAPPEIAIEATPDEAIEYAYIVGDADLNGLINLSDVTWISSLSTVANATYESSKVDNLNNLISNHIITKLSNGSTLKWDERFKALLITLDEKNFTFTCIESCDADQDGMVEQEDADEVADYYAAMASNTPVETLINTPMAKTIYIEN